MNFSIVEQGPSQFVQKIAEFLKRLSILGFAAVLCVAGISIMTFPGFEVEGLAFIKSLMGLSLFLAGLLTAGFARIGDLRILQFEKSDNTWKMKAQDASGDLLQEFEGDAARSVEVRGQLVCLRDKANNKLLSLTLAAPIEMKQTLS